MLQRDYILRLIQQFAKSLGTIVAHKKAQRLDEAEESVAKVTKNLLGLDLATLRALPAEHLVGLFRTGGALDLGKGLVCGDLLREQADIARLREEEQEALRSSLTALRIYLEVFSDGDADRIPERATYAAKVDELLSVLSEYELDGATRIKLFRFLEVNGRFADAEDLLFELLEAGEEVSDLGRAFYRRLLQKRDGELEAGNLPRPEVEEGLASLDASSPR